MGRNSLKNDTIKIGPGWPGGRKRLTGVKVGDDFTLELTFETGERRILDVKSLIVKKTKWSAAILEPSFFKQVAVDDSGCLEWPNEFGWHWSTVYNESRPIMASSFL